MKIDYLSYKRASNVCLLGLALQLVLGIILLVYGVLWEDASETAAVLVLSGVPVWLSLAVVYDLHRRERLEALETESLARSGESSSVFEVAGDELKVAARRLALMHKFLLPGVSLAMAAVLIGVGWWRLSAAWPYVGGELIEEKLPPRGWPIGIGIVLAVVGFIFARFVAGMAKQRVWENLRAGAAQSVAAAVMGLGLLLGHFVDIAGPDVVLRYIMVVFPAIMMVLGVEVVLNFVLTVYRPRKAGEFARPAFDSRILGFAAAPERIAESIGGALNYQFGFDVQGSWFYQLLERRLRDLVLVGVAVVWLMTFVAVVRPNEQGLLIRSGRLIGEPLQAGAYLKWPWPFAKVETQVVSSPVRLDLAGLAPGDVRTLLWTNDHKAEVKEEKQLLVVRPSAAEARGAALRADTDNGTGGAATTGAAAGVALIYAEAPVLFVIENLEKYEQFAQPGSRDRLLRAIGRREVIEYFATQTMDDVLGSGRLDASEELGKRVQAKFDALKAGVRVIYVGIAGVHPPIQAAGAFEQVISSEQTRQAGIESARKEATATLAEAVGSVDLARRIVGEITTLEALPAGTAEVDVKKQQQKIDDLLVAAGGKAASIIQKAKADRWVRHMGERGRAERYAGQLKAFRASPAVYAAGQYFQTLRTIMEQARVYITADSSVPVEVRMNLEDSESSTGVFNQLNKEQ